MDENPYKSPEHASDERRVTERSKRHRGVIAAPVCSILGFGLIALSMLGDGFLTRALAITGAVLLLIGALGTCLSMVFEFVEWLRKK